MQIILIVHRSSVSTAIKAQRVMMSFLSLFPRLPYQNVTLSGILIYGQTPAKLKSLPSATLCTSDANDRALAC